MLAHVVAGRVRDPHAGESHGFRLAPAIRSGNACHRDREIRSLRIYEGATEVQQLIIAKDLLKEVSQ